MLIRALLLSLAAAFAAQAQAADGGLHFFGSVGQAKFKPDPDFGATPTDDTDTAWKLGAGYMFGRNFGVEAGYADLGKLSAAEPGFAATVKASGLFISALGALPVGESFALLGRVGAINAEVKLDAVEAGVPSSAKATKLKAMYGLGAQYSLGDRFALRAELDFYRKLGDRGDPNFELETDVRVLSFGALLRF